MKTLSIQQPWATLICHGIKDVENRTWKPATIPGKILIHASSKKVTKNFLYQIPIEWVSVINNEILMNNISELKDLPTSAIIGYVEVKGFSDKTDSVWDGGDEAIKWLLGDAYLFDEPILDVKGKLNLFDYPEIDEDNLPPAHKIELKKLTIEGDELIIPVNEQALLEAEQNQSFCIDVTVYNEDMLCPEPDGILSVNSIRLVCGDKVLKYFIKDKGVFAYTNEETGEPIIEEWNGEEYQWYYIDFILDRTFTSQSMSY